MYIAVLGVEKENFLVCKVFDADFNPMGGTYLMNKSELANYTVQNSLRPINFDVDRHMSIEENSGDFKRLAKDGFVVLAEIKSKAGRNLGYRLVRCADYAVLNFKTEDIVNQAKARKTPLLHNGIIRNDTVNCYPRHKFPVITVSGADARGRVKKPTVTKLKSTTHEKPKSEFTKEQLAEIKACKSRGVDSRLIENPDLSPEQMRVLWVSKSKGAFSEYFASADYSVEVMKFYADRFYDKKIVEECSVMLSKPSLSVSQLAELYLCIGDGVDYTDFLDMSAEDIYALRKKNTLFSKPAKLNDSEVFDKAMNSILKLRGYL